MTFVLPPALASRRLRVVVDLALRELGERFVGLLFLAKHRLQKLHRLVSGRAQRPTF
jgi:hypothetical protein